MENTKYINKRTKKQKEASTLLRIKKEEGIFIKFNRNKETVHFLTKTKNKKVEAVY